MFASGCHRPERSRVRTVDDASCQDRIASPDTPESALSMSPCQRYGGGNQGNRGQKAPCIATPALDNTSSPQTVLASYIFANA